ncbi:cytochrome P450 [Cubamyces sp. BRFM 1775]|nr:cytochrome P450 [Cubamyces sp. BRFM 1775]
MTDASDNSLLTEYTAVVSRAILALLLAATIAFAWSVLPLVLRIKRSNLWVIPGPRSTNWLLGNLNEYNDSPEDLISDAWMRQYGSVVRIHGFLQAPILSVTDNRALNHIFTNFTTFPKPEYVRRDLSKLLCEGTRPSAHSRVLNQAFGAAQIREATRTFFDKALELRDLWGGEVSTGAQPTRINILHNYILHGLNLTTLDVIGQAAFNYDFEALKYAHNPNTFASTMEQIFSMPDQRPVRVLLSNLIPALNYLTDPNMKLIDIAVGLMRGIGARLVAEKKSELVLDDKHIDRGAKSLEDRDLVTVLVKAHMFPDVLDGPLLSEDDVLSRNFIIAGYETTSDAVTWCLYELARAPRIQAKLREEVLAVRADAPTMDDLISLPYLDMVVHETLRLRAPVTSTVRSANKTEVIPLESLFRGLDGKMHDSIEVPEGTILVIPFMAIHRSTTIWGTDATEFRPERWEDPPKASDDIPGMWGHLLSFGSGPRGCLGYRFAIVEMKALIFTLLRAFEFAPAVDPANIGTMPGIVLRPCLKDELERGSQMPLLVSRRDVI